MSTVGKCTRCHQQCVQVTMILADDGWSRDWIGDLCDDCYDDLNKFLDGAQLEK